MSRRDYTKRRQARRANTLIPPATTHDHITDPACVFAADGTIILRNESLFQPGHETICGRIVGEIVKEEGVRSARAMLLAGRCEIEFELGEANRAQIANRVATAVRRAIAPGALDGNATGSSESWSTVSGYCVNRAISVWQTVREQPGRLRLRNPLLRANATLAARCANGVADLPGVESCKSTLWSRDLDIEFNPSLVNAGSLGRAVAFAFEQASNRQAGRELAVVDSSSTNPAVSHGLGRAYDFAMAAGSFVLTIVGVLVPIVPTVPFLMATSYYLVRASPALNHRLLRSRFFGPILADLQTWGGLRPLNKLKLIGLALAFGVITVALIGPPVFVVVIMVGVYSATIYYIVRLPGVPDGLEAGDPQRQLRAAMA